MNPCLRQFSEHTQPSGLMKPSFQPRRRPARSRRPPGVNQALIFYHFGSVDELGYLRQPRRAGVFRYRATGAPPWATSRNSLPSPARCTPRNGPPAWWPTSASCWPPAEMGSPTRSPQLSRSAGGHGVPEPATPYGPRCKAADSSDGSTGTTAPRQDPLPRRPAHGHPQGPAPPTETPPQHQPPTASPRSPQAALPSTTHRREGGKAQLPGRANEGLLRLLRMNEAITRTRLQHRRPRPRPESAERLAGMRGEREQ